MKNIETILRELGIEVPEDKKEALTKNVAENYKTSAEFSKLTEKLDAQTQKAKDAEETLKKFEGIDPSKVNEELAGWKQKAADAEAEYNKKLAERDFNDALTKEIEGIKFSSNAAKRSVMEQIKGAGLKMTGGKILGLNDLIEQIKTTDADAFISEQEEHKAKFTTRKDGEGGKPMSKNDILAIKDYQERQQAIADNLNLFQ